MTVPVSPPGRHRDRGGPAQPGERCLRAKPVPVVPGGDQQLPSGLHPDPWQGEQRGLLVADNQTDTYEHADAGRRLLLSQYAWGTRAAPA